MVDASRSRPNGASRTTKSTLTTVRSNGGTSRRDSTVQTYVSRPQTDFLSDGGEDGGILAAPPIRSVGRARRAGNFSQPAHHQGGMRSRDHETPVSIPEGIRSHAEQALHRSGEVFQGSGSRCPKHPYRRSGRSSQPDRTHDERMRRKAVVDAWRAEHGEVCPGFNVAAHLVVLPNRLNADHIVPTSLGGDIGGELRVLCTTRNTRRGGRNRLRYPSRRSR